MFSWREFQQKGKGETLDPKAKRTYLNDCWSLWPAGGSAVAFLFPLPVSGVIPIGGPGLFKNLLSLVITLPCFRGICADKENHTQIQ
jgi:hypothetical protein